MIPMRIVDPTVTTGAIPIRLSEASGALVPTFVDPTTTSGALPVYVAPEGLTGAVPVTALPEEEEI